MNIFIKNMVCPRCIRAVEQAFRETGSEPVAVRLGEVTINEALTQEQLKTLSAKLKDLGFELLDDARQQQIEKIKAMVIRQIHEPGDENAEIGEKGKKSQKNEKAEFGEIGKKSQKNENAEIGEKGQNSEIGRKTGKAPFSVILSRELHREYSQLSKLFSETEGVTIEQYMILQKIEKAKELLIYNEMNLSEIAFQLAYSSVAHLSAQFKKVTGLTPSAFKAQGIRLRKPLDGIGANETGANETGANKPGANKPSADKPNALKPSANKPGANKI